MKKNMQKRLVMSILVILFTLTIIGSVAGADNSTDNQKTNISTNNTNLSTNFTQQENQTFPDPRIEHNGVIGSTVYTTIQDAIDAAQAGDTIWLEDDGVFTTTNNYGNPALVWVTKSLTFRVFDGGTATIDGSDLYRCVYVDSGVIASFYNIIMTDGNVDFGGAIYNLGTCNVTSCTFNGNTALTCGAIYNLGTCNVAGCTFTNNTACYGGAIYNYYYGTCNVTSCTFNGNTALTGGAIYNGGTCTVHFNRIVDNHASEGSAIYNNNGTLNATLNWWGSNNPDFDNLISGMPNPNYWLYMTITANPTTINNGETSLITVNFNNLFDGTTRTDLNPSTGHIPDGSPVNFQTDLGTIGCKSIDKTTTGGIATAILTANELAGIAHVNVTTDDQTLFVNVTITPKSGLYLTVTPSKANPVVGDTVVYTLKVGNKGPDVAKDVVMAYVVPEGLEFIGAKIDVGTYTYDPATRTITWIIGDVPVGDPYMWFSLRIAQSGHYLINPVLSTSTYDPTFNSETQSLTVNAATQVNAASKTKTIPLQHTGLPIAGLVLAVFVVFGGLVTSKKF